LIQRGLEDSTTYLDGLESGMIVDSASGLNDAAAALAFFDRELDPDRPAALDVPAGGSR
jgi:hypothetical protein